MTHAVTRWGSGVGFGAAAGAVGTAVWLTRLASVQEGVVGPLQLALSYASCAAGFFWWWAWAANATAGRGRRRLWVAFAGCAAAGLAGAVVLGSAVVASVRSFAGTLLWALLCGAGLGLAVANGAEAWSEEDAGRGAVRAACVAALAGSVLLLPWLGSELSGSFQVSALGLWAAAWRGAPGGPRRGTSPHLWRLLALVLLLLPPLAIVVTGGG